MSDLCLIIAPQNKNTILDRIAHEIGRGFKDPIYHYDVTNVPKADRYFITHYSLMPQVMMQINPDITPVTAFFTHDKGNLPHFLEYFNLCQAVVAESPEGMRILLDLGVDQSILHFVPEGGDNLAFQPHSRTSDGGILVCGTNYPDGRKNPDLVMSVMTLLQDKHRFRLIGKNWSGNNMEQLDVPYENYQQEYSNCSVYLSCSKLEGGGPNSLIEAMHANLVPVVSDTGNAREYIIDTYNGFIFPQDATAEQVAALIERAYNLNPSTSVPYNDIWQTVRDFTWDNYSIQMREIILNDYTFTGSQELPELTEIDE